MNQLDADLRANARVLGMTDRYGAAAVGTLDLLPFRAVDAYRAAESSYHKGSRTWQVHAAEQTAIEIEGRVPTEWGQTYHCHPRFVRLLEFEEVARTFGRCYVDGLVHKRRVPSGYLWSLDAGTSELTCPNNARKQ